jgi:hypothetical protein
MFYCRLSFLEIVTRFLEIVSSERLTLRTKIVQDISTTYIYVRICFYNPESRMAG